MSTLEATALNLLEEHSFDIQCEARSAASFRHNSEPHPATWLTLLSCGCMFAVCDMMRERAARRSVAEKSYSCPKCQALGVIALNYQKIGV